jgi:hypothetical protein
MIEQPGANSVTCCHDFRQQKFASSCPAEAKLPVGSSLILGSDHLTRFLRPHPPSTAAGFWLSCGQKPPSRQASAIRDSTRSKPFRPIRPRDQ